MAMNPNERIQLRVLRSGVVKMTDSRKVMCKNAFCAFEETVSTITQANLDTKTINKGKSRAMYVAGANT
jgi:hypothetical protein